MNHCKRDSVAELFKKTFAKEESAVFAFLETIVNMESGSRNKKMLTVWVIFLLKPAKEWERT